MLEHPFYQRWSAGELSAEELAFYAGEYRHAVVALAQASDSVAAKADPDRRAGLERHAAEEHSHVALWDAFADAMLTAERAGRHGAPSSEPLSETDAARGRGPRAMTPWSISLCCTRSRPASRRSLKTKLEGLIERYGYTAEGPAVEYFELHAKLDVEHARQARELIAELMSEDEAQARAQADRMVERATAALQGNWELLDGVDAHFAQGRLTRADSACAGRLPRA